LAAAALLSLGAGVFGGGCGGGGINTLQDFCSQLAQHDCTQAVVQACYGASDTTLDADTQTCIAARSTLAKCNPSDLPFHGEFADGCISAHDAAYGQTTIDQPTMQMLNQACMAVFNKGGTLGSDCTSDVDCDVGNGYACVIHAKGTCQVPNVVPAGESCVDPAAQCDVGLYCDMGGHCVAEPIKAEACSDTVPCASGFRCDASAHVCEDTLMDGAKCASDDACQGGFCLSNECASVYTLAFGSSTCQDFKTGL
jgi:hypothetical protein